MTFYLPDGGTTNINLSGNDTPYTIHWYNPRTGGALETGSVKTISSGAAVNIGLPPHDIGEDWVVLIRRE